MSRILLIFIGMIGGAVLIAGGFYLVQKGSFFRSWLTPSPSPELVFAPPPSPAFKIEKQLQEGPFRCPLSLSFCKNTTAYRDNQFTAEFTNQSPIYAVFDGIAEGFPANHPLPGGQTEKFVRIVLTNEVRGLVAFYYTTGTIPGKTIVKPGDVIGNASGTPIHFMNDKSLILEINKNTPDGYAPIKLTKEIFN